MGSDSERLCVALQGAFQPLDAKRVLWRARYGGRALVLDTGVAAVLGAVATLRTRAEHAHEIAQRLRIAPEAAAAVLAKLADAGLVVALESQIPAASPDDAAPPAPLVCVRTCDRPHELERLLRSFAAHADPHGRIGELVVVDDTRDPDSAAASRRIAAEFARGGARRVRYFGPAERVVAAETLEARDAAALDGLLDPALRSVASGGRTFNWSLLLSAGRVLALLDDDFVFPLRRARGAGNVFDLANTAAADTRWLDGEDAVAAVSETIDDPYGFLGAYLGRAPGTLLTRDGYDAASVAGHPVTAVSHLATGRVRAAGCGVWGSLTDDDVALALASGGATFANLLRAPQNVGGDWVWRAQDRPRLVEHAVFTPLLLDNRELVPFTGTHGKRDDSLFMMLWRAMDPTLRVADTAAAIGHRAAGARDRVATSLAGHSADPSHFLIVCCNDALPLLRSGDPEARLAALGALFAELARADDGALADAILRWKDANHARLVGALSALREAHAARLPADLDRFLAGVVAANERALGNRVVAAAELAAIRRALAQAAAAARVWPALWRAARERTPLECAVVV